eukprot:NODE_26895_length_533_cov_3.527094.p2 GENE.NODE_26895_length_533_cov_3.527094~~NODE_26895_length_533_cov_3.527094.p2  ORF type:complete len:57 (+),score=1.37 NODE_26895_length_533_cov_3.527094:249-419(+)
MGSGRAGCRTAPMEGRRWQSQVRPSHERLRKAVTAGTSNQNSVHIITEAMLVLEAV